jgi:2-amino-4-hydroxy-6-hydroxymethyldihydropteridine diphosphokinase
LSAPAPDSTGRAAHPLVSAAAEGILPAWAEASEARIDHMRRVATLLDDWAAELRLDEATRARWRAAAWLHDALREADPGRLAAEVEPGLRGLPPALLHGPAVASRLRAEGVADQELLQAVAYHTIGTADLGGTGRMLYMADFLDPGRTFAPSWRAELRARMPADAAAVLTHVVGARIRYLIDAGSAVRGETLGFWNALVEEGKR